MKKENKKILIWSSIIIILAILIIGVILYCKKDKGTELSISDTKVKELYDKIEPYFIPELYPDFASYDKSNFYMDKLVKYNDLSDESKLYYAYKTIANIERRWFESCDDLKGYSFLGKDTYQTCINSESEIITKDGGSEEWFFNNVNKEELENAYHKMYGAHEKMPLKTFTMNFIGVCLYSETKDDFLCFNQTGGDTTPARSETKLEKALEYKNTIELFDRYIWKEYTLDNDTNGQYKYYKSRFDTSTLIETRKVKEAQNQEEAEENAKTPDEISKKGALYKHTFKIDKEGNYYWYSSELIKE